MDLGIEEYILAQLEQPVMTKGKVLATDPRDGHELTAKEAIAMKIMQNALNGDIKAAQFIMQTEKMAKLKKPSKK